MSDDLKNIIFNISQEETDAIANNSNKNVDWNKDFFPVSAKSIINKAGLIVLMTVILCGVVYYISSPSDEQIAADAAAKAAASSSVSKTRYVNLDED